MKVIISHDIDHLTWSEHLLKDLYIPKYILKNLYYAISGKLPLSVILKRFNSFSENRINRIKEVVTFDTTYGVRATYFVGVVNGLSLSYSLSQVGRIIEYLDIKNQDIGIHGIAWDNKELMVKEYKRISGLLGTKKIGIRNHYLRNSKDTLIWMSDIGYSYDSTTASLKDPYVAGKLIEFPVCLMDVNVLSMSSVDLRLAKERTIDIFNKAEQSKLSVFTIIFHDNYFSDHYPLHMNWYKWLIPWVKERGYEFSSFAETVKELNSK